MSNLILGFKAFDAHELLCHFVAEKAGLYARENLQIELLDITFIAEADLPTDVFQTSCGAALVSAIRGLPQKIVFVATDKPMFWLYSQNHIKDISQLAGGRVATYPAVAPPWHFCNLVLKDAGIDVEKDISLHPARDDTARFGLLKSANVEAAVLSSAIAPQQAKRAGMNSLCFFGNKIRVPTTGLAINQSFRDKEPSLSGTFVNIHKESLALLHENTGLVATVMQEYFDIDKDVSMATANQYQQYYTRDGKTSPEIARRAIDSISANLNIDHPPAWEDIYIF